MLPPWPPYPFLRKEAGRENGEGGVCRAQWSDNVTVHCKHGSTHASYVRHINVLSAVPYIPHHKTQCDEKNIVCFYYYSGRDWRSFFKTSMERDVFTAGEVR